MSAPVRSIEPAAAWARALTRILIAGAIVVYTAVTVTFAARKRFWFDELLVVHLTGLPDLATFWDAMAHGPDLSPPLYHLAVRGLRGVLGDGPAVVRLPAVVGFGVMVLCLFRFASRRVGPAAAWPALLLPFATRAYDYAIEARPYALVLGATGLALCCWQDATDGVRRRPAIVGMALGLAAAVSSHFYAVLVFLPMAAGELVRSRNRRRVDLAIWAAFAVGASPLLCFGPMIANARGRMQDFWARPEVERVPAFYHWLLTYQGSFLVVAFGLVAALLARNSRPALPREERAGSSFPIHELVAVAGFALMPAWTFLLAEFVTRAYVARYALPAVVGLSTLVPILLDPRLLGPAPSRAMGLILLGWVATVQAGRLAGPEEPDDSTRFRAAVSLDGDPGRPVVVADPVAFLQVVRYAPARSLPGLFYVNTGAGTPGERSAERELGRLGHWVPLPRVDLGPFLEAHRRFRVFGSADSGLMAELLKARGRCVVIAERPDVFRVEVIVAAPR